MPGVARVGIDAFLTGVIVGPGIPNVLVNGLPISVIGDKIAPHGKPPHTNPTVITGSPTVFAGGRPITVQAISSATCMHKCTKASINVQST